MHFCGYGLYRSNGLSVAFCAILVFMALSLAMPAFPASIQWTHETGQVVNNSNGSYTRCGTNITIDPIFLYSSYTDSFYYPVKKAHFFLLVSDPKEWATDYAVRPTTQETYRGLTWDSVVPGPSYNTCQNRVAFKSTGYAQPGDTAELSFSEVSQEWYQQKASQLGITPQTAVKYGYAVLDLGVAGGSASIGDMISGYSNSSGAGCSICDRSSYYLSEKTATGYTLVYTPSIDAGGTKPVGNLGNPNQGKPCP